MSNNNIQVVELEHTSISMNLLFSSLMRLSSFRLSMRSNGNTAQSADFVNDGK